MANFAIKNLNGWNNVEGKIFLGEELGLTGAEASVQRLAAGQNPAFLHHQSGTDRHDELQYAHTAFQLCAFCSDDLCLCRNSKLRNVLQT